MFQVPAGDGVVGAIGVEPGLKPDPGIAVFGIGKAAGDFYLHRIATGHGHVNFPGTGPDRIADGEATDVGNSGALANQCDFGRALAHALHHATAGDVGCCGRRQDTLELGKLRQAQMVRLKADFCSLAGDRCDRLPEIVAAPVGVGDVVRHRPAPRLAGVDPGGDGLRNRWRSPPARRARPKLQYKNPA